MVKDFLIGTGEAIADMWHDGLPGRAMLAVIVGTIAAVAFIPVALHHDSAALSEWKTWCAQQGDTTVTTSEQHGVMMAGKTVVPTTTTTYSCLDADGRLLGTH